jgi:hypothetical protein
VLALRFTADPTDPWWELRPVGPAARIGLLGWITDAPQIDDGVPHEVARVIARAACRSCLVTFLHPLPEQQAPSTWQPIPRGQGCVVKPPPLKRALRRPTFPLIATGDPDLAESLFYADGFSWELRGQMALLFPTGSAPPPVTYDALEAVFGGEPIDRDHMQLPAGLLGLLLPAVDGDFAQVIALDEPFWLTLPEMLAEECRRAALGWSVISQEEFKGTKWSGPE